MEFPVRPANVSPQLSIIAARYQIDHEPGNHAMKKLVLILLVAGFSPCLQLTAQTHNSILLSKYDRQIMEVESTQAMFSVIVYRSSAVWEHSRYPAFSLRMSFKKSAQ
jgi:cell division protein FtsL